MRNPYTKQDVGCYVDSARGLYAIDAIVSFAKDHGFPIDASPEDKAHEDSGKSWADYEHVGELEDDIDSFMNEHSPVENCSWGRNENGDWGLWSNEE